MQRAPNRPAPNRVRDGGTTRDTWRNRRHNGYRDCPHRSSHLPLAIVTTGLRPPVTLVQSSRDNGPELVLDCSSDSFLYVAYDKQQGEYTVSRRNLTMKCA